MDLNERRKLIEKEMNARFGEHGSPRFFRAPGRVDLMGSHTDYNEGFILAATIDRDIIAGARKRAPGILNLFSLNTDLEIRVHLDHLEFDPEHKWANYVKGVIKELLELKIELPGMDLVFHGEVPVGASLSSSAALEAVTLEAALGLAETRLPPWEKVHLTRRAENLFVGVPCGIMDQFTVFMGEKGMALLLDCRSLEFEKIPMNMKDTVLLVIDSAAGRELAGGKYRERVEECEAALEALKSRNPKIAALRDASMSDLEAMRDELPETLFRRARHVITENQRVKEAAEALRQGDMKLLARLMEECYESCKRDYENSSPELDLLHDLALRQEGVMGVRICGAGWGGCLLALVEKEKVHTAGQQILKLYEKETGRQGRAWAVKTSDPAGPLP